MPTPTGDPWLLTPGPLTTSATVKQAMLHDWGSRDEAFIAINRRVRERLLSLAGGQGTHVSVLLQGSGTFAIEAMIGTLLPADGKLLILSNGAYGERMVNICRIAGHRFDAISWPEDQPVDAARLEQALVDKKITHVAVVHCETTSGILNPIRDIADVTARYGRGLLIDSMSAFGALPIDARDLPFDALAASSNKCLEGVPGMAFIIVSKASLEACAGNARSLSLDLHDQWQAMERHGQWRFTPPTHVILALDQALREHTVEGGIEGRGKRYRRNCTVLVDGMRALGFETLLPGRLQAPIIVTFRIPGDPKFKFDDFYGRLRQKGYVIYPGKLTTADSFRIGCIGRVGEPEMQGALVAIKATMDEIGMKTGAPPKGAPA